MTWSYLNNFASRIGINQLSPQATLHISGSTSETLLIASSSTGPVLFVGGNGNVGIGTNLPSYRLDVSGSGNFTNGLTVTGSFIISGSQFQYSDNTDVDTGTETVVSVATGSYRCAFFDYIITSGSNARAGTVFSVWGGTSVEFTETSTNDIGTTSDVTLSTILSGSNVELRATTISNNWTVKSLVRML